MANAHSKSLIQGLHEWAREREQAHEIPRASHATKWHERQFVSDLFFFFLNDHLCSAECAGWFCWLTVLAIWTSEIQGNAMTTERESSDDLSTTGLPLSTLPNSTLHTRLSQTRPLLNFMQGYFWSRLNPIKAASASASAALLSAPEDTTSPILTRTLHPPDNTTSPY